MYMFIIVIFSWWIDPLVSIKCLSLSLATVLYVKSILSDINIRSQASFWLLFAWSIFFHPLTLNLFVSLGLKWVSYKQHIAVSWFLKNYSVNICLLIDEFNSFTLKVITNNEGLVSAIVLFVFCVIFCCSSTSLILTYFVFDFFFLYTILIPFPFLFT